MSTEPLRHIAHLDMDAFYASVELLRYPELRGKAVVIGGGRRHQPEEIVDPVDGQVTRKFATLRGYVGRGVITTATYEARALGLHSAQGLMKAAQLAPDAILLPTDFDRYRDYSRRFKAAVWTIAPQIEDRGIDEIYIDLTGVRLPEHDTGAGNDAPGEAWWRARDVAKAIKERVRAETGLSCSIAVAPNKLLAKISSELDKPDGLTMLAADDIARRIWPLPPRKINDEAANGRDERPVETFSEPKSISRETTFERDLHPARDREALSRIFTELCVGVAEDLQRKGYVGRTIGLKLRYDDFKTVTRDQTILAPTQDAHAIRRAAGECLKRVPLDRRIRLLGVRMGALCIAEGADGSAQASAREPKTSLFDDGDSA